MDLSVGIAYGTDLTLALSAINNILQQKSFVLKEPPPVVGIASLGESFISLTIKPWVKVEDLVIAQAEIYQGVLEIFRDKQIEIPSPRREIRLVSSQSS